MSVWWDRDIPPGRVFDEVIEEALDGSRCVIVMWSKTSVKSDWVRTETTEGAKRKVLVPVLLDEDDPARFRRIQAANLTGWGGEAGYPEFQKVRAAIAWLLERAIPAVRAPPATD